MILYNGFTLRKLTRQTDKHLLIEAIREYAQDPDDLWEAEQVISDLELGQIHKVPMESVLKKEGLDN